jgi:hypothetical protein
MATTNLSLPQPVVGDTVDVAAHITSAFSVIDDLMDGDVTPAALGTASAGSNVTEASRADHVHSSASLALTSPVLTTPQLQDTSANHQYITAVSELAADRTVTMPLLGAADEFVFKDHAVTLTNKALTSPVLTTPQLQDTSSDHQYITAVSELAADRIVTMPQLSGGDEFVFKDHAVTMTNKTITSAVLNTGVSGTAVKDEDAMGSNSATHLATQQSIKAYADTKGGKVQQHSFVEGSSGGISTTSNSYADITDMKRTLTTTGGNLVARMTMNIDCDVSGTYFYAAFQLDSATEVGAVSLQAGSNGETHCVTCIYTWTSVSEASHTVDGRWKTTSSNSVDCDNNERYMELMEVDG